jgi:YVTN family beta-propeller protein
VAVTPDSRKVYVADSARNTVSVINTATNEVAARVTVGMFPDGVAVAPDGSKVYVASAIRGDVNGIVSVIDTATDTVIGSPITVGNTPFGVAVIPDGSKVYVANFGNVADGTTVSVIHTATSAVTSITGFSAPAGLAVTPDGSKVYVANRNSNAVLVIDTATDTVISSPIPVGTGPTAFGLFIQPNPAIQFAGTPGKTNCHGKSVSALARQYGGLNSAAASLGFLSVKALQDAIMAFCGG